MATINHEALRVGVYSRLAKNLIAVFGTDARIKLADLSVDVFLKECKTTKGVVVNVPMLTVRWDSGCGLFEFETVEENAEKMLPEVVADAAAGSLYDDLNRHVTKVFEGARKDMLQTWRT